MWLNLLNVESVGYPRKCGSRAAKCPRPLLAVTAGRQQASGHPLSVPVCTNAVMHERGHVHERVLYLVQNTRPDPFRSFLGSEAFVTRHCGASQPLERLREVPRAQRRPLAKPLASFARQYPDRCDAMAHAFLTGVYTMQEIADYFGVHYSTVSRAVHSIEARRDTASGSPELSPNA